ncbi:hypothetical protein ARALYDRAFT_484701 [Arabidopsis lyrata subsp. lyrata]|uniref:Uncharacterized protein n=2 Tax=Arabidopsis lyrata subsp. lyrata TaxID=81972 RepID=D7LNW9_ARALL|nr:hypothetical protein ARALYDRAFT_484701 [Arabidopsis lyrata subsp. lyrata]
MAATMVMVVSLVMVLSLVLVLLAELYCSLLLRRRRNHHSLNLPITTVSTAATTTTTTLNQVISTTTNDNTSPSNINSSSPNPLYTGVLQTPTKTYFHHEPSLQASLDLIQETIVNDSGDNNFIYISNPMYSNEATSKPTTPFETPESSPSRLETGESSSSSSGEEEDNDIIEVSTPTLAPMKDLPEKACSVSLKNVETSASESNSSSGSPYTSPSW